jgi:hypothetical protein
MIKNKITTCGGYVVGDGKCPVDPDEFMAMFMDKIMEARRAGLNEIGIPDDVIDEAKQKTIGDFLAAPTIEIEESKRAQVNSARIYRAFASALDAPQLNV